MPSFSIVIYPFRHLSMRTAISSVKVQIGDLIKRDDFHVMATSTIKLDPLL